MRVISLTSIPPRFKNLSQTLESLRQQEADEVRLYIPRTYRRYPEWNGTIPEMPDGITVCRCKKDYGPATKVLPAVQDLRGTNTQILFCDDDGVFRRGWADRLFTIQAKRPNEAVAGYVRTAHGYVPNRPEPLRIPEAKEVPVSRDIPYRIKRLLHKTVGLSHPWRRPICRSGYGDIFFGVAGVVVRPSFFDEAAFDIPEEAWAVDDIWLSANLARVGIPIFCPRRLALPVATRASSVSALLDLKVDNKDRQGLNRSAALYCQKHLSVWK